jgi:hypothetical protein
VDLDPKDEDDRALLRALPSIGTALLAFIARSEPRVVVLFSTRPRAERMRVMSLADAVAAAGTDAELLRALDGAPSSPQVRVVALRRDGTVVVRDPDVSDITEAEDTFPA